ncbi:winged helix-turn-helix transcriptional regulator [Acinetobacter portensis]|uniref:winged helix-turn-helix transcriptional regulator n=1 Tax=Acinetobacter portensis TaxID=1839785 RepID=UPI003D7CFD2F
MLLFSSGHSLRKLGLRQTRYGSELKELEINGIIKKVEVIENGLSITKYGLTESGKNLEDVIVMMVKWGKEHRIYIAKS